MGSRLTKSEQARPLMRWQRQLIEEYMAEHPDPLRVYQGLYPTLLRGAVSAGLTPDDVRSAGYAAMVRAAQKFDPYLGTEFKAYVHAWMRGFLTVDVRTSDRGRAAAVGRRVVSGDAGGDDGGTMWEAFGIAGREGIDPARRAVLGAVVARWLDRLPARWRRIVVLRFGLDGGGGMTHKEVGEALGGVSRQAVQQMERVILDRIRHVDRSGKP